MVINSSTSMNTMDGNLKSSAMSCVAQIMTAWCNNNKCEVRDLPNHISLLYNTILQHLSGEGGGDSDIKINETVFDDYIICLEDGEKLKMLKRHLWSKYRMTVDEYKKKWRLGYNYPSVAPNYTKKRSSIAKDIKSNRKAKNENKDVATEV